MALADEPAASCSADDLARRLRLLGIVWIARRVASVRREADSSAAGLRVAPTFDPECRVGDEHATQARLPTPAAAAGHARLRSGSAGWRRDPGIRANGGEDTRTAAKNPQAHKQL